MGISISLEDQSYAEIKLMYLLIFVRIHEMLLEHLTDKEDIEVFSQRENEQFLAIFPGRNT